MNFSWNSELPRMFPFSLTASVAKAASLQKIPFTWNAVSCTEYEKQVKDTKATTRYDFIDMIQVQLFYHRKWFVHHAPKQCGDSNVILSLTGGQLHVYDLSWPIYPLQMLYYMDDYVAVIKFFHSLLREKGRLMIIHEAGTLQTSVASSGQVTHWMSIYIH